jgi:hypothetical protein
MVILTTISDRKLLSSYGKDFRVKSQYFLINSLKARNLRKNKVNY